jgi:hypothetical protein
LIKSTGYKVYWTGRYLERIENIARFGLYLTEKGMSVQDISEILGTDDIFSYIINEFQFLREDIRGFGDEANMNALSSLETAIYTKPDDAKKYFINILNSVTYLGNTLEENLKPKFISIMPKKQEEIGSQ